MRFVTPSMFVALVACGKTAPTDDDVECIGEANAKHAVVYLHGRDSKRPSTQEMRNRDVLRRLSEKLGVRIALPRAKTQCTDDADQICWGWQFDDQELAQTAKIAQVAADKCLAHNTSYVVLGFSNGGYALDTIVARCKLAELLPHATRVVTMGASMLKGTLGDQLADRSTCGDITLIAGTNDAYNFDPGDHYVSELAAHGGHARSVHVPMAAHELDFDALAAQLSEMSATE
jgi:hypothetical protein